MNILEVLKKSPGFVYQIGTRHYFLGKWICKRCTDTEITDTHMMYDVCSAAGEETNAHFYFEKLRVYSDFALDIPYNAPKIQSDLTDLLNSLSALEKQSLEKQYLRFAKDCGLL